MRALIGSSLLASTSVQPREHPFEIYDTRLAGLTLRMQPSGARSFTHVSAAIAVLPSAR